MKQSYLIFLLIAATGCAPNIHRGQFSLISTESIPGDFEILTTSKVSGEACFNQVKAQLMLDDGVFDASVSDALGKVQDATILLDAEFEDKGSCIIVSGTPARKKQ
ncbi:MAG: hypothetical protein AAF431_12915 [Pseudomonadota bacterium]